MGNTDVTSYADVAEDGTFSINDAQPGTYRLATNADLAWCMAGATLGHVTVPHDDVTGLVIKQRGLAVRFHMSHAAPLLLESVDDMYAEPIEIDAHRGENRVCLSKPGTWVIHEQGCIKFGPLLDYTVGFFLYRLFVF